MSDDEDKKGAKVFHFKTLVPRVRARRERKRRGKDDRLFSRDAQDVQDWVRIADTIEQKLGDDKHPDTTTQREHPKTSGQRRHEAAAYVRNAFKPVTELSVRSTLVRRVVLALPSWVTSNRVTAFRTLLLAPILAYLAYERYNDAALLYGFSMFLDFVDGAIAKIREQKTPEESILGKVYDSTADKIVDCGVLIYLMANDRLQSPVLMGFVIATCVFAGVNVLVRMYKLLTNATAEVGASDAGKIKLVLEVVAILLILSALATGSNPTMDWATLTLGVATAFAFWSFLDQCRSA